MISNTLRNFTKETLSGVGELNVEFLELWFCRGYRVRRPVSPFQFLLSDEAFRNGIAWVSKNVLCAVNIIFKDRKAQKL